ncbi:MAG: UbiD family decarboxylase [Oscillospiraceae bacterium]|nr:UbiD family decarboxylase [Oscillospiraceae bacterium]
MRDDIFDLRSALDVLRDIPGELQQVERPMSLQAELIGYYHKLAARGTSRRPTRLGPTMLFTNIQDWPGARIAIGVMGSRRRVGCLLGVDETRLPHFYNDCLKQLVPPVEIPSAQAACHEEVHLASDPDFDLRSLLPVPLTTVRDAGPYITMGLCYASDPDDRSARNAAVHRLCIQGRDEMTIGFGGYRHMGVFRDKAFAKGKGLPISINIGLDPALYLASSFEPPTTPLGFDELSVAGAMRDRAVELTRCAAIDEMCIANAEIVIEGELVPDYQLKEDQNTGSGRGLPEFPGYSGPARMCPVVKVKAVTCRRNPILQTCIGSSEEHVNMAGIPNEASVLSYAQAAVPGLVQNVYCPPSGCGKFDIIVQVQKKSPADEGKQRQMALGALGVLPETKNLFIVDEDVDIFDPYDVQWALTTRFRPDLDMICAPGVRCHIGDPTEKQFYDPNLRENGLGTKVIYDASVPFKLKESFWRPEFMDVDVSEES